ncbi:zinc-binding alcohol dehydrogenase [Thalassococcus sp. S3]|uniref:zinc-dependent alcohol dehydrogenase n=1 Tax=Thalassococcus sp. S3 TaxID=2017482 RepID=UPI001023FB15|nr:zinc-binding alcohol dehydrogenase [Thalassococcus sp. S3]QBF30541.1 dehydrogenase [Thalassococcus sp. S3]
MTALALWCVGPGEVACQEAEIGQGVLVETLYSGISRGTERLVHTGHVPETEWEPMRCPNQEGRFPFPVKYGYCAVGRVMDGTQRGRSVFALYPHQSRFRLPETALLPLPEEVPEARAILAANTETALNILWDSQAGAGDRITIVGAGVVGLLTAYLAAKLPGAEVTLVDINAGRARLAQSLDCGFAAPPEAPADQDCVIHLSATAEGLATAIGCAAPEAAIVEGSWYGTKEPNVPLGGAFHSKRLRLVSSQVGQLPPGRRPRWTYKRRLAKALELLRDPRLDALISGECAFADLPNRYSAILSDPDTLCHRVRYS